MRRLQFPRYGTDVYYSYLRALIACRHTPVVDDMDVFVQTVGGMTVYCEHEERVQP